MTKLSISIFLTSVLFFACSERGPQSTSFLTGSERAQFKKEVDTSDTYYTLAKKWSQNLPLTNIENGSTGFELRLWFNHELVLHKKLIAVKYSAGKWSAKAYSFRINNESDGAPTASSFQDLIPTSGWNAFQGRLSQQQVWQFPNYSYAQGDKLVDDGTTYFLEVANPNLYKFTWFSNPKVNAKNNKDAQRWQGLVELFHSEFGTTN